MLADVLLSEGLQEASAMALYTDIFRLGEGRIQRKGEPPGSFKTNPVLYMRNNGEDKGHYRILFEDEFEKVLAESARYDFAILNGITYFGRQATLKNASKCYALIVDLDGQTDETLRMFLYWTRPEYLRIPRPNYIILSGHNVHLYWLFQEPINLYPETKRQLKEFKYALINKCWNEDTSTLEHKQFQGINQGFRPVSGKSKIDGVAVRAFRLPNQPKWTIEEINEYVSPESRVDSRIRYAKSEHTIEEARDMWPEWYRRRIELHENGSDWAVNRSLYEWWKRQIKSGATYHHRYYCIMCLSVIAMRCSHYDEKKNPNPVTYDELKRDAFALKPFLNGINQDEPFTDADILSALEGFDPNMQRMRIETVSKLTAIEVKRNVRRRGRDQKTHLKIARSTCDILYPDGSWRNKNGAPTKRDEIVNFAREHPGYSNRQIAETLGVSRNTVNKWMRKTED